MANILIVDDDQTICDILTELVVGLGHRAESVQCLSDALHTAQSGDWDVVFLDVRLPDGSGLDAVPEIRSAPSAPEVIVITGFGDPDGAEAAIASGAWIYIDKPFSVERVVLLLNHVFEYRTGLSRQCLGKGPLKRSGIIGGSAVTLSCLETMARAADSEAATLVTGETGTGKELFARAIHENSRRAENSFVVVDCAALPENLVESVLFGHARGAFTGAVSPRDGLVKQADGGTLFLDEIGEMPPSIQKAFLRVLQEQRFRPVGGKEEVSSDFRLVAATNRDLAAMVRAGEFRKDLFYRINTLTLRLPPLRDHLEDVEEIARHHIRRFCDALKIEPKEMSAEFVSALRRYPWPGNVRELVNTLESSIAAAHGESSLLTIYLPTEFRIDVARASVKGGAGMQPVMDEGMEGVLPGGERPPGGTLPFLSSDPFMPYRQMMDQIERKYFSGLVLHVEGDIKKVCAISGLSRSRVYALLKKHGISRKFR